MNTIQDAINELIEDFTKLHNYLGNNYDNYGGNPILNSIAYLEFKAYKNAFSKKESVETLYSQANLLIEGAADHLTAFLKTMNQPIETIAPWTLVRGILETCAISSWLLDPTVNLNERVKRSFAFRFEGLKQQYRLAKIIDSKDSKKIERQFLNVEIQAKYYGFKSKINNKNEISIVDFSMPSITSLIDKTLDKKPEFSILSGMAHGHPWAYQQLGFRVVSLGKEKYLEKNFSIVSIGLLFSTIKDSLKIPIDQLYFLYGWDVTGKNEMFSTIQSKLKMFYINYVEPKKK